MKSTGIIKHIDSLGRFKIPKELLQFCNMQPCTKLLIKFKGKKIILKNQNYNCIFCFSSKNIHDFNGKNICSHCIKEIKQMF